MNFQLQGQLLLRSLSLNKLLCDQHVLFVADDERDALVDVCGYNVENVAIAR